jgi:hypothetical protein
MSSPKTEQQISPSSVPALFIPDQALPQFQSSVFAVKVFDQAAARSGLTTRRRRLWVIDASITPRCPLSQPNVTTIMMVEHSHRHTLAR